MTGVAIAFPAIRLSGRWLSLLLAAGAAAVLMLLYTSPQFRVDGIDLVGASLVPGEEILDAASVHGLPILWVDADDVKKRVEAVSGVQSASVLVEWPAQVKVKILERVPVIVWQQAGAARWVDRDGRLFDARGDLPGLLPVTVDEPQPSTEGAGLRKTKRPAMAAVPPQVVLGALQLKALRPNIELLHYDPVHGLSYQDGRGWRGYFGTGTDMDLKLRVYESLVDSLLARQISPGLISVENADAPYYRK